MEERTSKDLTKTRKIPNNRNLLKIMVTRTIVVEVVVNSLVKEAEVIKVDHLIMKKVDNRNMDMEIEDHRVTISHKVEDTEIKKEVTIKINELKIKIKLSTILSKKPMKVDLLSKTHLTMKKRAMLEGRGTRTMRKEIQDLEEVEEEGEGTKITMKEVKEETILTQIETMMFLHNVR